MIAVMFIYIFILLIYPNNARDVYLYIYIINIS